MSAKAVKIAKIQSHPHASRLKICLISDGDQKIQVVCGAKNIKLDMKTIHSPVGSTMPSGIKIQKADFRGHVSEGMLCSAKDLGISQETGIIQLPDSINLGTPLSQIPREYLSSIPWHSFTEIDSFWQSPDQSIHIQRKGESADFAKKKFKLISKTYFDGESYLYRDFTLQEDAAKDIVDE